MAGASAHREGMAWLHRYRAPGIPWIALDDTQECFGQNTAQVMIASGITGFTLEHEDEFRLWISCGLG